MNRLNSSRANHYKGRFGTRNLFSVRNSFKIINMKNFIYSVKVFLFMIIISWFLFLFTCSVFLLKDYLTEMKYWRKTDELKLKEWIVPVRAVLEDYDGRISELEANSTIIYYLPKLRRNEFIFKRGVIGGGK